MTKDKKQSEGIHRFQLVMPKRLFLLLKEDVGKRHITDKIIEWIEDGYAEYSSDVEGLKLELDVLKKKKELIEAEIDKLKNDKRRIEERIDRYEKRMRELLEGHPEVKERYLKSIVEKFFELVEYYKSDLVDRDERIAFLRRTEDSYVKAVPVIFEKWKRGNYLTRIRKEARKEGVILTTDDILDALTRAAEERDAFPYLRE